LSQTEVYNRGCWLSGCKSQGLPLPMFIPQHILSTYSLLSTVQQARDTDLHTRSTKVHQHSPDGRENEALLTQHCPPTVYQVCAGAGFSDEGGRLIPESH
jgi:hypothetical protein